MKITLDSTNEYHAEIELNDADYKTEILMLSFDLAGMIASCLNEAAEQIFAIYDNEGKSKTAHRILDMTGFLLDEFYQEKKELSSQDD